MGQLVAQWWWCGGGVSGCGVVMGVVVELVLVVQGLPLLKRTLGIFNSD
jgi:hypothetical protein